MIQRSDPGHPFDLTQLKPEQLQALVNDVTGKLRLLERVTPIFQVAPQHGLTRDEAEQLMQSYKEFQDLAKKIDFNSARSVTFESPFPKFHVINAQDYFVVLDASITITQNIYGVGPDKGPVTMIWPPIIKVPNGFTGGKGTIIPLYDRVSNWFIVFELDK
jgi:hypothetical protein